MKLEGIHHITAITGDAPRNVEFYAGTLGLRMVKKTVNQDDPTVYHLFYADEQGSPGADLTFFEYPGAARGRPGDGQVHRIVWRVAAPEAIEFWAARLAEHGVETERVDGGLRFADPEGLDHELQGLRRQRRPADRRPPRDPARARAAGLRRRPRLRERPRPQRGAAARDARLPGRRGRRLGGPRRRARRPLRLRPGRRRASAPSQGAGSVHHIAFATQTDEQEAWRDRVAQSGNARPTPVIDRFWFRSVYFREPSGVLFELATMGPGFDTDEDIEHLGEKLTLPPRFEPMREQIERVLTPLPNPRAKQGVSS